MRTAGMEGNSRTSWRWALAPGLSLKVTLPSASREMYTSVANTWALTTHSSSNRNFIARSITGGIPETVLFPVPSLQAKTECAALRQLAGGGCQAALILLFWRPFFVLALPPERNLYGLFCPETQDRKSTRLNSSHVKISYAVFCLKKKT